MDASIIISVYKNTKALQLILESLRVQTVKNFEVIVSEDGEDFNMKKFVEEYDWFCSYQHLTQPDIGWRKNRAMNRAIINAKNEWLILIDGDCILHPRFVEMHLRYAKLNRILLGRRVKLSEAVTNQIMEGQVHVDKIGRNMFKYAITKKAKQIEDGIFIPFFLNKELHKSERFIGCNLSMHRDAIFAINGFDEDYKKPCVGEDDDINWRFKAMGYEFYSVRHRAIQYHLHHKENWIEYTDNMNLMKEKQLLGNPVCERGINLHLV